MGDYRPRPAFFVNLGVEAVSASTPYVLVDLSDVANFAHLGTKELHLLALMLNAEKAPDGGYDVWVGVVVENDATNGTAEWLHVFHIEAVGNSTDSTDRFAQAVDFTLGGSVPEGINLAVDTANDTLQFFRGNQSQAGNTNWQNDENRTSPVGATTQPGVGDLVVEVEEISGTGTIDFSLTAVYEAT